MNLLSLALSFAPQANAAPPPEPMRAVLIVRDEQTDPALWSGLIERLGLAGVRVESVDFDPNPEQWKRAVETKALSLGQTAHHELVLVGERQAANLSLNIAGQLESVDRVVALSPQLRSSSFRLSEAGSASDATHVFVAASDQSHDEVRAADFLLSREDFDTTVEWVASAADGARLLNAAPSLEPNLFSWIQDSLPARATDTTAIRDELQTGDLDEVVSTGVRLEERTR